MCIYISIYICIYVRDMTPSQKVCAMGWRHCSKTIRVLHLKMPNSRTNRILYRRIMSVYLKNKLLVYVEYKFYFASEIAQMEL